MVEATRKHGHFGKYLGNIGDTSNQQIWGHDG